MPRRNANPLRLSPDLSFAALRPRLHRLRWPQNKGVGVNIMRLGGPTIMLAVLLGAVPALAQDSPGIMPRPAQPAANSKPAPAAPKKATAKVTVKPRLPHRPSARRRPSARKPPRSSPEIKYRTRPGRRSRNFARRSSENSIGAVVVRRLHRLARRRGSISDRDQELPETCEDQDHRRARRLPSARTCWLPQRRTRTNMAGPWLSIRPPAFASVCRSKWSRRRATLRMERGGRPRMVKCRWKHSGSRSRSQAVGAVRAAEERARHAQS